MKTRNRLLLPVFLLALCGAIFYHVSAQPPVPSFETKIQEKIDTEMKTISGWKVRGYLLGGITVAIAILGVVAGFTGKKQKWVKPAAGVAVTVLTACMEGFFETDRRTYWMLADEGAGLMRKSDLDLASYPGASLDDKTKLYKAIQENFGEMDRLKKSLHTTPAVARTEPNQTALFNFPMASPTPTPISQQESKPLWLLNPPRDMDNISFVGAGFDYSVNRAAEASLEDAKRNCLAYLLVLFEPLRTPKDTSLYGELANFLVSSPSVRKADSHYEYLPFDSLYIYTTLLQLNKGLMSNDIAFFADTRKPGISVEPITKTIMTAGGLSDNAYGAAYRQAREVIRIIKDSLSFGDRKGYLYANDLQREGNFAKSVVQSTVLTGKKKSFAPALHGLARTYELRQDKAQARTTYEMALRQVKGAHENTYRLNRDYGLFLYTQKAFVEAISFLKKWEGR